MGKVKNMWIEQQEADLEDHIDPIEWDSAFPDNVNEYIDYISKEYDLINASELDKQKV